MSSREWKFRLDDIIKAIDKICAYTEGLTATQFKKDEMVIDAVLRNFEIIGEASNHIPLSIRKKYPDIPWSELLATKVASFQLGS